MDGNMEPYCIYTVQNSFLPQDSRAHAFLTWTRIRTGVQQKYHDKSISYYQTGGLWPPNRVATSPEIPLVVRDDGMVMIKCFDLEKKKEKNKKLKAKVKLDMSFLFW